MKHTAFIKRRPHLLWWVKDLDGVDERAVVEATLTYGNWDDVQALIKILGLKNMARIFRTQLKAKRSNYPEKTKRFFTLYFKEHA